MKYFLIALMFLGGCGNSYDPHDPDPNKLIDLNPLVEFNFHTIKGGDGWNNQRMDVNKIIKIQGRMSGRETDLTFLEGHSPGVFSTTTVGRPFEEVRDEILSYKISNG